MRLVDLVDPQVFPAECNRFLFEPFQDVRGKEGAGATGDLGLQVVAETVDSVEVLEVYRRDDGTATRAGQDQPLVFQVAQGLPNRDEARAQVTGGLPQRELLTWLHRPRDDRPTKFSGDLIHDRSTFD